MFEPGAGAEHRRFLSRSLLRSLERMLSLGADTGEVINWLSSNNFMALTSLVGGETGSMTSLGLPMIGSEAGL